MAGSVHKSLSDSTIGLADKLANVASGPVGGTLECQKRAAAVRLRVELHA